MGLTRHDDPGGFLAALDDHPTTVEALADRLDLGEEDVRRALAEAEAAGLAVDWGHDVWATTWRAKLQLHPSFFHVWLPGSLGIGLAVTSLALWLNGPPGSRWLVVGFALSAVIAAGLALRAQQKGEAPEGA